MNHRSIDDQIEEVYAELRAKRLRELRWEARLHRLARRLLFTLLAFDCGWMVYRWRTHLWDRGDWIMLTTVVVSALALTWSYRVSRRVR